MGEVNTQLLTQEISTLSPQQLQEVMHFVGYLKSLPVTSQFENESEEARQSVIKASLQKLRDAGTFNAIEDPVEWQQKVRADRSLPGRVN